MLKCYHIFHKFHCCLFFSSVASLCQLQSLKTFGHSLNYCCDLHYRLEQQLLICCWLSPSKNKLKRESFDEKFEKCSTLKSFSFVSMTFNKSTTMRKFYDEEYAEKCSAWKSSSWGIWQGIWVALLLMWALLRARWKRFKDLKRRLHEVWIKKFALMQLHIMSREAGKQNENEIAAGLIKKLQCTDTRLPQLCHSIMNLLVLWPKFSLIFYVIIFYCRSVELICRNDDKANFSISSSVSHNNTLLVEWDSMGPQCWLGWELPIAVESERTGHHHWSAS